MGILDLNFGRQALMAGLLVGLTCGVLSVFVVLQRLSFVGVGISHGTLCGVSIGLLFGWDPLGTAVVFSVLLAWFITWLHQSYHVPQDTAVGIVFPVAMGVGMVLISLASGYQQDLLGYLVGSLVAVNSRDLVILVAVALFTLGLLVVYGRELTTICFQEEVARVDGYRTRLMSYLILTLLAVVTVVSIRVVGIILVSALLVIPASTTFMFRVGILKQPLVAGLLGALVSVVGLVISYALDVPPGAAIVVLSGAVFLLVGLVLTVISCFGGKHSVL